MSFDIETLKILWWLIAGVMIGWFSCRGYYLKERNRIMDTAINIGRFLRLKELVGKYGADALLSGEITVENIIEYLHSRGVKPPDEAIEKEEILIILNMLRTENRNA